MKNLYTLVLESLQASQNLSLEQQAQFLTQRIERLYKPQGAMPQDILLAKNLSNNLNSVLIKFIRDLFAPSLREKYERLFKIGTINTLAGIQDMETQWLNFYNTKGHLAVLRGIALCMRQALNPIFAKPNQNSSEIIQLLAYPQNLSDIEFIARFNAALIQNKQDEMSEVVQYADMIGVFLYNVCEAKFLKLESSHIVNPFKVAIKLNNKKAELYKELYNLCEKWRGKLEALAQQEIKDNELKEEKIQENKINTFKKSYATIFSNKNSLKDWEHTIEVFAKKQDSVLCVIRVFNHKEIAHSFGQEGYERQVIIFKKMFIRHFETMHFGRDVFEPKEGVFYLLLEGERAEVDFCFEAFCHTLSQQVFSYREHKHKLEFDGKLFYKTQDFLQTLLELMAYIGEV